jgi:hypothetical protein
MNDPPSENNQRSQQYEHNTWSIYVWGQHMIILLIALTAFIIIPHEYARLFSFLIVLMVLGWFVNGYTCFLDDWEKMLRGMPLLKYNNLYEAYNNYEIKRYTHYKKIFKTSLSNKQLCHIELAVLGTMCLILLLRAQFKYNFINFTK